MSPLRRFVVLPASALSLAALTTLAPSCAENDDQTQAPRDDASIIQSDAGSAPDTATPNPDECAADPAKCTTHALTCDEASWCPVAAPLAGHRLLGVWGSGSNDVWAVGTSGTIVHWDGTAWTSVGDPAHLETYGAVWGSSAHDVWVASSRGLVLRGTGIGTEWTAAPAVAPARYSWDPEAMLYALWGTSATDVWAGGDPYPVDDWGNVKSQWCTSSDPDAPWTGGLVSTGSPATTPPIRSIWGSSADDVWAVGGADGLYYSTNSTYGKTYHATSRDEQGAPEWTEVDSQSLPLLYAVWGSSKDDVWAVGDAGTIRHYTAGLARWDIVESPTTANLRAVWGSGPKDVWIAGDAGAVFHFDGTSWKPSLTALSLGAKPNFNGIWGTGPSDVWLVGEGVILHSTGEKPQAKASE